MAGEGIKKLLKNRTARILLLCLTALLLLLAVWKVFFSDAGASSSAATYQSTEREARLCQLLKGVEGIGNATAMITEEDGVPVSAIIVFDGADSILARMRVLDITATALNIEKKYVQVYPANK